MCEYNHTLLQFGLDHVYQPQVSERATVAQWVKRCPTDLGDRVQSLLKAKSSQP